MIDMVARKVKGVVKSEKRSIAEQLCVLYHEALKAAVPGRAPSKPPEKVCCTQCDRWFFSSSAQKLCESCRKRSVMKTQSLDEIDKTARIAFMRAAQACIELGADPREFIVAQFSAWRSASAYHKKLLLPQPPQLASLAARVRYLQHKANVEIRVSRKIQPDDGDVKHRFFVEERHLKGLARMQRRDPVDVLTEQPEQFSPAFLKHKGVWDLVQDIWEDRNHS